MKQQTSLAQLRKKEGRGKFLTILLIIDSLSFWGVYKLPYKLYLLFFLHQIGFWGDNLLSVFIPLEVAIYIGMWKWRKTAVYGHFIFLGMYLAIYTIMLYSLFPEDQFGGWAAIYSLVILGIWYFAIKRKWHLFS